MTMAGAFSVSDNGIGIPEEFADKVFRDLFSACMAATPYSGTGIGLALCKKDHRTPRRKPSGSTRRTPVGTRFFPFHSTLPAESTAEPDLNQTALLEGNIRMTSEGRAIIVLLIEDDPG